MKKLVLALSAATLIVGIAAASLWRQLDSERDHLADLRARVTEMEGAQAAPAAAAQTAPAAAAIANPDTGAASPATLPAAATSAVSAERVSNGVAKGIADVLASAEGQDMTRNVLRATFAQMYPDLATELRMTPAEAEKLMDLLIKQASESAGDLFATGAAAADSQRKMLEKQVASEKEIARTLGNRYPAWQEYQGTAAARQQVSQLRSLLGTGEDALSEAQSKPLIAALGAEQTRINKEEQNRMSTAVRSSQTINVFEDQLKSMSAGNQRLVNTASSHLTSNQLDRYKRMVEQQETMLRTIMGSMTGQGSAAGQGGAPR